MHRQGWWVWPRRLCVRGHSGRFAPLPGVEALWCCGRVWNNEEEDWAQDLSLSFLITHHPVHWTPQMEAATRAASIARDSLLLGSVCIWKQDNAN